VNKVGLVTALQNFGQWADGFPEVPSFDDMSHNDKIQSAIDSARTHVQDLFKSRATGQELELDNESELTASANDDMWDQPYYEEDGVDRNGLEEHHNPLLAGMPDLEHTTEKRDYVQNVVHNYAVETLATPPELYESGGHDDQDIVAKGGHIKGSNATQGGLDIIQQKRANKDFSAIILNEDIRARERDITRQLLESIKEAREFLANLTDEDLDTNNTSASSVENRKKLREYLKLHGMDLDDYINEDGTIDRERLDEDLKAKDREYRAESTNANKNVFMLAQTQAADIDTTNLLGAPIAQNAFSRACAETDETCSPSYEIDERTPEEATNEILASMGFAPVSHNNSLENDAFASVTPPSSDDGFASTSYTSADDGFSSASTSNSDNNEFASASYASTDDGFSSVTASESDNDGFASISTITEGEEFASFSSLSDDTYNSVAEAIEATEQPEESSLLPPGEWKTMEISSAFQERSLVAETAQPANQPIYGGQDNADIIALPKIA